MANRQAHDLAGGILGGGAALITGRGTTGLEVLAEVLGSTVFGVVGSKVPDWAEPPVSSWHRGRAHSVTAGALSLVAGSAGIGELQAACDERIATLRTQQSIAQTKEEAKRCLLEILLVLFN